MKKKAAKKTPEKRRANSPEMERILTIGELSFYVGVPRSTMEELMELELISPCKMNPEPCFPASIIPAVKRMVRLHSSMDLDVSVLPLVMDLLKRINDLECQLARLTDQR